MRTGIAANAGSHTFPDTEVAFPYGLKGVDAGTFDPAKPFGRKLVILLGEDDTDANQGVLDQSEPAMLEGRHRLERGQNLFNAARAAAREGRLTFGWEVVTVPKVGHENEKMSAAAADLL